ncbi:helicase-related protein [[Mycoplasma] cavipharyngis]|uniref:helicase-related protein n=1 Tax=[Mycoplasma] cavipharyngis TaxID=92757 RepID=UPI003703C094
MTATEKIYTDNAKNQAKNQGYEVYSMDDETHYGPLFHCLNFGQAISQGLLSDYRVIVFEVQNSEAIKGLLNIDTYTNAKVIAALNAISKKSVINAIANLNHNYEDLSNDLDDPMKRVIAFCSTIKKAEHVANVFNQFKTSKYLEENKFIVPEAKLIEGKFSSTEKRKLIDWLSADVKNNCCHILTNARCLTEGVDVPSLDGVIFMDEKQSQVDIIQAVGRVMRKGDGKNMGYVIIPVFVNDDKLIDQKLSENNDYKTVWKVIAALRSHDERIDNQINKIGYTDKLPENIWVVRLAKFISPDAFNDQAALDTDQPDSNNSENFKLPTEADFKHIENFKSVLVKKCGNRLYWEDWSKDIGNVTNNIALKIKQQLENNQKLNKSFNVFLKKIQKLLNPTINQLEVINMLAEHVVTLPVLQTIFQDQKMIDDNLVTQLMKSMVQKFHGLENEKENLQNFYDSVIKRVEGINLTEGRQELIRTLFEKFFQYALPKTAEKFGIVYTPIEIVDFIINSVSEILKKEFNQSIAKENIKILDPFTGTGTFIVRLLEKFKELGADNQTLKNKYLNDVWCNEISLLAYYIALVNIEDTYSRLTNEYLSFNHAVLTDTFQLSEKRSNENISLFENDYPFQEVHNKAKEEDKTDIKIIIGNPPYSGRQRNTADNNKRTTYFNLDQKIKEKYIDGSYNSNSLYDSYIRAFCWATDRLDDQGIVGFVTNGGFITSLAFRKFRESLKKEFYQVYIFNLKGNYRKYDPKEGGNVFGNKCGTAVSIVFLVKNNNKISESFINYYQIADNLKTQEKLKLIKDSKSIYNLEFEKITPDKNNDWINKTNSEFSKFISLGNKKNNEISIFNKHYSLGIATAKDKWVYSFNKQALKKKMNEYIKEFNRLVYELHNDLSLRSLINSKNKQKKLWNIFIKILIQK